MSNSRDKILAAVLQNQPSILPLPNIDEKAKSKDEYVVDKFIQTAKNIGSVIIEVQNLSEVKTYICEVFPAGRRISTIEEFNDIAEVNIAATESHSLENVEVGVFNADIGVAENSALWLTNVNLNHRVAPFICQHLVLLVLSSKIVSTMHHAYELIGLNNYEFGTFIAGPSKTADIEQSLVLGAHGPRSLHIMIVNQ